MLSLLACCTSLLLLLTVHSQRVRFPGSSPGNQVRSPCDESRCLTISNCPSITRQPNWRRTVPRCGFTSGRPIPRFCCPERVDEPEPSSNRNIPVAADASTADCGTSRTDSQASGFVMGGEDAAPGIWPWMVGITMVDRLNRQTPWCTGFLIDNRHVLTAAHCFHDQQVSLYETRIGNVDMREGQVYPIQNIAVHEGYRPGQYYDDIAVISLSRQVNDRRVNPICLPSSRLVECNGEDKGVAVAGWGAVRPGGNMSYILKELRNIPIVTNEECSRSFFGALGRSSQFGQGITSGILCAGFMEGGKDSCSGDSGGPLMCQENGRWHAIGIVSFGYQCGMEGYPGGYTRIIRYLDWIQRAIRS